MHVWSRQKDLNKLPLVRWWKRPNLLHLRPPWRWIHPSSTVDHGKPCQSCQWVFEAWKHICAGYLLQNAQLPYNNDIQIYTPTTHTNTTTIHHHHHPRFRAWKGIGGHKISNQPRGLYSQHLGLWLKLSWAGVKQTAHATVLEEQFSLYCSL